MGVGGRSNHDVVFRQVDSRSPDLVHEIPPRLDAGSSRDGTTARAPVCLDRSTRKTVCQLFPLGLRNERHAALDRDEVLGKPGHLGLGQLLLQGMLVRPQAQGMHERYAHDRYQQQAGNQGVERPHHARLTSGTNM